MKRFDGSIHRAGIAGILLAVLVAGCKPDQIAGPDPFQAVACVPPAELLVGAYPQPLGFPALRDAFMHAAGPMATVLGTTDKAKALSQAIYDLGTWDGTRTGDTACRLLLVAFDALNAMPQTLETLPDRDGIRLVLILAAGVVKAATS